MTGKQLYTLIFFVFGTVAVAQEGLRPMTANINYFYPDLKLQPVTLNENTSAQKTSAAGDTLHIPFLEDFFYAPTRNYPDQSKWMDSAVFVNSGYPIAPPSIGVATFDGLNKHGYPYKPQQVNMNASESADTLTSKPIFLRNTLGSVVLDPSFAVALSFYYQARGWGEPPEATDSLVVDFYKPKQKKWQCGVWFSRGNTNPNLMDTAFKRAFISIRDTGYFHDGFKFRIRNRATTAGDFDHWHVDYIRLDKGRDSIKDTVYYDLTFANVPTSFLQEYSAMPFNQYQSGEMAKKMAVRIKNNSSQLLNITYKHKIYDQSNNEVYDYIGDQDNIKSFKPHGYYSGRVSITSPVTHTAFTYAFPTLPDSADFTIKHYFFNSLNNIPDFFPRNDTVIQYQRFRNYYATDDGSCESGYYVNGQGGKVAMKIRLNVPDTLRAMRIYFDPVGSITSIQNPNSIYTFKMCIWASESGVPGTLIYRDTSNVPKYYGTGFREFPEYKLRTPLILSPGTYYVGFQQQVAAGLTVGFDRNLDHRTSLYYDSGSGWKQSQIGGSLMLRPVFGKIIPPPVGLNENSLSGKNHFLVYPNPSADHFTIRSSMNENLSYTLMNSLGQKVMENVITLSEQSVPTNELNSGVYVLVIKENGKQAYQEKILIQH